MYVLVMAGGAGTRLWPLSRKARPKQLLDLTGKGTMIQATVNRVLPLTAVEKIYIAANRDYAPLIQHQLPDLPPENIIQEPSGKNTAPCIGLGALHMAQQDEVMAVLPADHFIADEEGFRQALLAAEQVAREGYLVTLGIQPTQPETGYGYIHRAEPLGRYNNHTVYRAARFLEKPDLPTAQRFVDTGEYYWNGGIFIWQVSTLLEAYRRYMPEFARQLDALGQAIQAGQPIDGIWSQIQAQSIDIGVMEKADRVAVVPVDIGWNDVGSWAALYDVHASGNEDQNVVLGTEHIGVDTRGALVHGNGRLVATIGLDDVIIVDTDDALLVCARDRAQEVKQIVDWLKENQRRELL
ncbi:MAG: mannose-1-phosphate guanylyltransferase [Chloroflexi bacterium]|nr:MAG: mannose-1-phosphate guanylyltransferase [Chloroflexota bacterium]